MPIKSNLWAICIFRQFLIAILVGSSLVGCEKNYGIPKAQLLTEPLEPNLRVDASADRVWDQLLEFTELFSDCGIQVRSRDSYLLSWCEKTENWRDLGQDTVGFPCSVTGCGDQGRPAKWAQNSGKGTALTSVWLEPGTSDCYLHIRRVYYGGAASFPKIAHSRGDYERDLHQWLVDRLSRLRSKP